MADTLTLPFGIQSEYDRLVMRGGPTPQLKHARIMIGEWLTRGPHWFEAVTARGYQRMDGAVAADNDTTEEEFYAPH